MTGWYGLWYVINEYQSYLDYIWIPYGPQKNTKLDITGVWDRIPAQCRRRNPGQGVKPGLWSRKHSSFWESDDKLVVFVCIITLQLSVLSSVKQINGTKRVAWTSVELNSHCGKLCNRSCIVKRRLPEEWSVKTARIVYNSEHNTQADISPGNND